MTISLRILPDSLIIDPRQVRCPMPPLPWFGHIFATASLPCWVNRMRDNHTMSSTMVVTLLLLELRSSVENWTCDSFDGSNTFFRVYQFHCWQLCPCTTAYNVFTGNSIHTLLIPMLVFLPNTSARNFCTYTSLSFL